MPEVVGIIPLGASIVVNYLRKLDTDEPVDPFSLCNKGKLDSCLKTPFQRPPKEDFFEDLIEKSSLLFFLLIENHVLPTNGNKRLAVHMFLMCIYANGYKAQASDKELYDLALSVTTDVREGKSMNQVLNNLQDFCRKHVIPSETLPEGFEEMRDAFFGYLHSSDEGRAL